jgi:hypothetical protein
VFQSSPDPKAGRYLRRQDPAFKAKKFQSSPDLKAGRYHGSRMKILIRFGFQSSPDPKAGRYLCSQDDPAAYYKFQSSPDPKAGRYCTVLTIDSIRYFSPTCAYCSGLVKNALFIFTLRNASYGPGNPIHLASGQFRNHKSVKQL